MQRTYPISVRLPRFAELRLVVHTFERRVLRGLLKMMNRWFEQVVLVRLRHDLAEVVRPELPIDH